MTRMGAEITKCLRSDAQQNRARILHAATQAFAEQGLGVSLVEIARRAGVGNATLHRNFTKEQLVDELFSEWFGRRRATAERALIDPDPWRGFATFCEEMLADDGGNCSTGALFAIRPQWRECFTGLMAELLARVQHSGDVRSDLTTEDLMLGLIGLAATMPITAEVAPHQWRRQLAVLLHGMRATSAERLPGFPVTADQLQGELCHWSAQLLRAQQA